MRFAGEAYITGARSLRAAARWTIKEVWET